MLLQVQLVGFLVTGFVAISPADLIHYGWDYLAHFETTQTP